METIGRIIDRIALIQEDSGYTFDLDEFLRRKTEAYNDSEGKLTEHDCPKCKNRGYFAKVRNNTEVHAQCECMNTRRNLAIIRNSGLGNSLEEYTFDKYAALHEWQKNAKELARRFLSDHKRKWFFIGGQVGSGKTHLCTAIVGEFIKCNIPARYMLWRDVVVRLKAVVTDDVEYNKIISPLKSAELLYIDDFFKTARDERGSYVRPTPADVNIAFEILNYRYCNPELITIISSERTIGDMLDIDEATGSRIYDRTKEYCVNIRPDRAKNYRLGGIT